MLQDMSKPGLKEAQGCYGQQLNRSQYRYAKAWSEESAGMLRDMPKPGLKKAQGCYEICPYLV